MPAISLFWMLYNILRMCVSNGDFCQFLNCFLTVVGLFCADYDLDYCFFSRQYGGNPVNFIDICISHGVISEPVD